MVQEIGKYVSGTPQKKIYNRHLSWTGSTGWKLRGRGRKKSSVSAPRILLPTISDVIYTIPL